MFTRTIGRAALLAGLVASSAAAHPGHGLEGGSNGWLHYVSELEHLAPTLLATGVVLALLAWRRARLARDR